MMNKGQIHRYLGNFLGVLKKLIKSNNEMSWEIRDFTVFRKKTPRQIHEIKNFLIFVKKSRRKVKVEKSITKEREFDKISKN